MTKTSELDIIYEDENFLAINKPAGIIVHPANTVKEKTLVDILLEYCPEIKGVGDSPERPGIVHRLDKEVSGLLIIAKTQGSFEYLKKQFQNQKIKKEYLALVHGRVTKPEGIIKTSIGRSIKGLKMAAHPEASEKDRHAITEYEVVKSFQHYTLLKIIPKTGRPHQIRVHLNSVGYPIIGDEVYHPKKLKVKKIGRIFLHASTLGFYDLKNSWQEFHSSLPKELKEFLNTLR